MKILFIAKNIPTPKFRGNSIIIKIAKKISLFSQVHFLFPKEIVPIGLHLLNKYKLVYKLKAWAKEGFDITISKYVRLPIKDYSYSLWNTLSKRDIKYYNNKGPFDIIHAHFLLPDGWLAFLYSQKYHVPYIVTLRNADIRFLENANRSHPDFKKAKKVIENAISILTLNYAYKNVIDDAFGVDTLVIPHGIEEDAFYEEEIKLDNKITITCVSTFDDKKNVGWVIKAIKEYNGKVDINLRIIGSGKLEGILKSKANNDSRIRFLGRLNREEVLLNMRESQIFALPSSEESFGLVYLEAAASKNAIIAFEKEGIWGVFEKDREVLFCKDYLGFKKQLHDLIEKRDLRLRLINDSFKKAKNYRWPLISEKYEEIYQMAINKFEK